MVVTVQIRHDVIDAEHRMNKCAERLLKEIYQKVIKGHGKANIDLETILQAIISHRGYDFIMANFFVFYEDTYTTLIRRYLNEQLKLNKNHQVLVKTKTPKTLEMLASDPVHTQSCGSFGVMISKQVFIGHGSAIVDSWLVKTAIDADLPYTIIIDNFDILEIETDKPILLFILEQMHDLKRKAC